MSSYFDIFSVDKVILLRELWYNQKSTSFYFDYGINLPIWNSETDELAKKAVNKYVDYFNGKFIKYDISENIIDSYLYDRDIPYNKKFEFIVNKIKNKK